MMKKLKLEFNKFCAKYPSTLPGMVGAMAASIAMVALVGAPVWGIGAALVGALTLSTSIDWMVGKVSDDSHSGKYYLSIETDNNLTPN